MHWKAMAIEEKKIILTVVRHGETDSNKAHLLQGQVNTPLNETGLMQATLLGKSLENTTFDDVFTSDLDRAIDTARAIVKHNIKLKDSDVETLITRDVLIREKSFGKMESIPGGEYHKIAQLAGYSDPYYYLPDGGESPNMVRIRVQKFINKLFERAREKEVHETWNVLLVSHGGWIRELVGLLNDHHKCSGIPGDGCSTFCPNSGVSKFQITLCKKDGNVDIKCTNFYSAKHLF